MLVVGIDRLEKWKNVFGKKILGDQERFQKFFDEKIKGSYKNEIAEEVFLGYFH